MNDGLRAMALLGGGALVLFAALFAGLRWSAAQETGDALEPVAVGPIHVMYPDFYADSVVRAVFANYRLPDAAGGTPELRSLSDFWVRTRSDGTVVSLTVSTLDESGELAQAGSIDPATGRVLNYIPGEGCTAQFAPGPAPEELRYVGLPVFADLGAFEREGWTRVATPAAPIDALFEPEAHPAANFRLRYDPAALEHWEHAFGAVDLHRAHWELGVDPGTGIGVSRARLPGNDPPGTAEAEVFLLIERFDRVPGLQAMREAVNLAELCRDTTP